MTSLKQLEGYPLGKQLRPGTAVGAKGRQRVEDILDAATRILIDDGYAGFTLRRIADKTDMGLGNLQYYFGAKEHLLSALLQRTFDRYAASLDDQVKSVHGSAQSRFLQVIDYLLNDQLDQASCSIFWELWALSAREPEIAHIMNEYYDIYLGQVAAAIRQISPDVSQRRAQQKAAAIVALIEGASLFRGYGKPKRPMLTGFEQVIREACAALATDK